MSASFFVVKSFISRLRKRLLGKYEILLLWKCCRYMVNKILKLSLFHSLFWSLTQLTLAHIFNKIPATLFSKYHFLFKTYAWEKNGTIWNKICHINKWKKYIPEGSRLNPNIYNKKHLTSFKLKDIHHMIVEMRRAECMHWVSMLPIGVFVKAPRYIKVINLCYVVLSNGPIIIAQRYNRPRLEKYYMLRKKRGEHSV